jgi:hypothetical protein
MSLWRKSATSPRCPASTGGRCPIEEHPVNPYAYCGNGPVNATDPDGMEIAGEFICHFRGHEANVAPWMHTFDVGPQIQVDPSLGLCEKICAIVHESVHLAEFGPCCHKAVKAYMGFWEKDQLVADRIFDAYQEWEAENRDWAECKAYSAGLACDKVLMLARPSFVSYPGCCYELLEDAVSNLAQVAKFCPKARIGISKCPDFGKIK